MLPWFVLRLEPRGSGDASKMNERDDITVPGNSLVWSGPPAWFKQDPSSECGLGRLEESSQSDVEIETLLTLGGTETLHKGGSKSLRNVSVSLGLDSGVYMCC